MVSAAAIVRQIGTLGDALDRLESCLCDHAYRHQPADREMIEMAAHGVLRAWVQTRRRCQELERSIAESVSLALDLAGLALDERPGTVTLGVTGRLSPHRGVADVGAAGDTCKIHRLAPAGGIGGGR